ncbi:hypothetical protein INF35_07835 [Subdoligranulum sp. DSM 109015]|uniref:Uncharacterized protein n=1 Tax=Gemmiger gallinarum TaxID=2779354 RepID=A0ABR9R467_9FIRM|nr:hypothetical protein [Gemmiger gallinarum]MBE5037692.1 hypothetical protein [Gemmiger gallinarum]
MADGISLGLLWIRSGRIGHPGANISRSLSVERTDCAEYSIFKVLEYFLLYTANMKFSLLTVSCFFKRRLLGCGSTTGFGVSPQICVWISKRYASKTICQQVGGLLGPSFVPVGGKTGWESESCYDSLSADISCLLRKSESCYDSLFPKRGAPL